MRARPRVCCAEQGWRRGRKAPEAETPLLVAEGRCRVSGLKPLRFQHSPWPAAPRSRAGGSAGGTDPVHVPSLCPAAWIAAGTGSEGGEGSAAAEASCSRQRFASAGAVAQALRFLPEVVLLGTAYPAAEGGHGLPFLGSPHTEERGLFSCCRLKSSFVEICVVGCLAPSFPPMPPKTDGPRTSRGWPWG